MSALFQIVRLGIRSKLYSDCRVPYAKKLRALLESLFDANIQQDTLSKYALCNLFITSRYIHHMKKDPKISPFVEKVSNQINTKIKHILSIKSYWDAC